MDLGLLAYGKKHGFAGEAVANWTAVGDIPFDFERRRLSVVLQAQSGGSTERTLLCKVLTLIFFAWLLGLVCATSTAWRLNKKGAGVQDAEIKSPTHECCCNIFAVFVVRIVLSPSMFITICAILL